MIRDPLGIVFAVVGAVIMSGCAPAPASSEPQRTTLAVDQVAGAWSLRGPDGKACRLSLANLVIDGVRPVRAEDCAIDPASQGRSWRATADGFELLGSDGAVVMAFRRIGEDTFEATAGGYSLTRAPSF